MHDFIYTANPARIVFRKGAVTQVGEEVERLGIKRALVLSSAEQSGSAAELTGRLGPNGVATFTRATMHTPVEVTEAALQIASEMKVDGLVAVGGGSTIGLSKALALRTDLPQIVIPTTYAGSEVTAIIGETQGGIKRTQTTLRVLPEVVLYDVELTLGLPPGLSATSGLNAIAHAVEALYARDRNPIISMMATEGVRALAKSLPVIVREPENIDARSEAQYGAWLCGTCLGAVGMALHHKLCHTLGGTFNLPHAETHTAVLPHALRYNAPLVPDAIDLLSDALDNTDPARALFDLAGLLEAPRSLRELGMPEDGIDEATDLALANPYWNPRPLNREAVRACIAAAWAGSRPAAI
jgi:maleylacetate reductase